MKSIQIDLSCAGENECDRGGGFRGHRQTRGRAERAKNNIPLYMGQTWRDDLFKTG